jgi:tetratricopeptide (TPR) repeat protein
MYLKRDFDKADYEANKALRLNPNHTNIIMTRGWISIVLGDHDAAIEQIQRARKLNPYMPGFELATLGTAYFDAKRYKDAIQVFSQVTDPPMWTNYELAASYAYLGDEENAARYLDALLERASRELAHFPGNDDQAWRSYFESYHIRRNPKDLEHLIEGLRKAGLAVS